MAESSRISGVRGSGFVVVVMGVVLGLGLVACSKSGPPTSSGSPSPTPTDPKVAIEQAYLAFWNVWTTANRTLDPAPLSQVMTGSALDAATKLIEQQRTKNQPVMIEVSHNYFITIVDSQTASVDDRFVDHSVRLDPKTGQPIEKDPNKPVHDTYTLRKVNGQWKVAEIIGFRSSPSPSS